MEDLIGTLIQNAVGLWGGRAGLSRVELSSEGMSANYPGDEEGIVCVVLLLRVGRSYAR